MHLKKYEFLLKSAKPKSGRNPPTGFKCQPPRVKKSEREKSA